MAIPNNHNWRFIFHFTDYHNLDSIVKNGLLCPNIKKACGIEHKNIANMTIQERRAKMCVPVGPGGNVHDYVPFYFSSINPMLLTLLLQKNVDQNHIVYLCLKIDRLEQDDAVFTDASANRNERPNFYSDTVNLGKLEWDLIDSRKWRVDSEENKHKKMAEALIYQRVGIEEISGMVVYNEQMKKVVEAIFKKNGIVQPTIMYDFDERIRKYSFYYTKFFIASQKDISLVTGPITLFSEYRNLLMSIKKEREKRTNYHYNTVGDLIFAIDNDFTVLSELKELQDLQQNYHPHNDSVKDHTLKVVTELLKQDYYIQSSVESKALLKLAAYLHDMGKGPKSKWREGIMDRAYPDHPADAIPMLKRIITKEIAIISEDEIRQLCMLVIYHDIVGDCIDRGRDKKQIVNIIKDNNDLEMLFAIAIADAKAISSKWASKIVLNKISFCEDVLALKNE